MTGALLDHRGSEVEKIRDQMSFSTQFYGRKGLVNAVILHRSYPMFPIDSKRLTLFIGRSSMRKWALDPVAKVLIHLKLPTRQD